MSRKQEIVSAAIDLFNRDGYNEVSVKDISESLGISPGNLTYHYPTKNELLNTIFDKMYSEMEGAFELGDSFGLCEMDDLLRGFLAFQQRYVFFFLDLTEILRTYPAIEKKYKAAIRKRWKQTEMLITLLAGRGLLRQESYKGSWSDISKAVWSISTFWPVQKVVAGDDFMDDYPVRMIWSIIEPELTNEGVEEYQRIKL